MPCAPLLRFSDCPADTRAEAGEVMSGVLEVTGATSGHGSASCPSRRGELRPQRVFVRVYRTSSEHFAVLYPVRAIVTACRPLLSINLKSCCVKPLPGGSAFRVSPRACEGAAVTFKGVAEGAEIGDWLRAFSEATKDASACSRRKKVSDHRLPLPVLEESEEDLVE